MSLKNKPTLKEKIKRYFVGDPGTNNVSKGRRIAGAIIGGVGLLGFLTTFALIIFTNFGNNKSMNDTIGLIATISFATTVVLMIVGGIVSKGKKGFSVRVGNIELNKHIRNEENKVDSISSMYSDTRSKEEIDAKAKENIELVSQYERLYEQGLISKEELERRKNNVLK